MSKRTSLLICLLALTGCAAITTTTTAQARRAQAPQSSAQPPPPPRSVLLGDPKLTSRVDVSGKLEGQTYVNKALGFTLTLPQGWQAQDTDVQQQLVDASRERMQERTQKADPAVQRAVRSSIARSTMLLVAVKPSEDKVTANIMAIAENIAIMLSVRTPRQYLELARHTNSIGDSPIVLEDEIKTEQIGEVDFAFLHAHPRNPQLAASSTVQQRYYAMVRKNYAIMFALTYGTPEQLQSCLEVLKSLKLQ